jgi:hypothetical protein
VALWAAGRAGALRAAARRARPLAFPAARRWRIPAGVTRWRFPALRLPRCAITARIISGVTFNLGFIFSVTQLHRSIWHAKQAGKAKIKDFS